MKKVYLLSAVYLFYSIGMLSSATLFVGFTLCAIIFGQDNPTINYAYIGLVIEVIYFVIAIFISGRFFIQWITIDEQKIKARCIFLKLQELKWEEVVEIRIAKFEFGSPGAPAKWLVFYDGKEKYQGNGIITKKGYITLRYSKKREMFIKQIHPEIKWVF